MPEPYGAPKGPSRMVGARMLAPLGAARAGAPWRRALRRLLRNRAAVVGGSILFLVALSCFSAPLLERWVIHFDPQEQDLALGPQPPLVRSIPPSDKRVGDVVPHIHWFGTDELGRDVLIRTLYGGRISLMVGILATLISLIIGVAYGAMAGYAGGATDQAMMRAVDVLYCLPYMFFVILLMVFFGRSLLLMFLAIGAVEWLTVSRIVRGQVLQLKNAAYVVAAEAMGVERRTILVRHLVPNVMGHVIVYATLTVPAVMLQESFLSFLGLGVQPPTASWGSLANEGAATLDLFPWLIIFPGLALSITLFSLNFLGDGLRDALDPRARE